MKRKVSDITKDLIQLEEKREAIMNLYCELKECLKQAIILTKKGVSKYPKVTMKRAYRVMGLAMKAKIILSQIDIVKATPIFPSGGLPVCPDEKPMNIRRILIPK